MNFVYLKGIIKNIRYSHTINDTIFNRADLIVRREDGREDLLFIKFKSCVNLYIPIHINPLNHIHVIIEIVKTK